MLKSLYDREIVIINVGANTMDNGLTGLLCEDGSFFFMPLPERGNQPDPDKDLFPGCPNLPTYKEFVKDERIWKYIPNSYLEKRVHNDPEFDTFTYGDNPETIALGRAANLKNHLRKDEGDLLFFFAGLTSIRDFKKTDDYQYYFIGFFEVCDILKHVTRTQKLTEEELRIFGGNAHIKRGQADPRFFDSFWVWKGSDNSRPFSKAVPFDRDLAKKILTVRKTEQPYTNWYTDSSYFQQLSSRTRAARLIIGDERKRILLELVETINDVPLFKSILKTS